METPEGFGCVEPQFYRAAALSPECLPFLASLNLKSILTLNPGNPLPSVASFAESSMVKLVHMPLQPWRSTSDYSAFTGKILRDAVQFILDKRNYPVLVVDTNIFVGIIRKMQHWRFSSILAEYTVYSGVRAHYAAEVYLEMLQVRLIPHSDEISDRTKDNETNELDEDTEIPLTEEEDGHDPILTIVLPPENLFPGWFKVYYDMAREPVITKLDGIYIQPTASQVIREIGQQADDPQSKSQSESFWIEVDKKQSRINVSHNVVLTSSGNNLSCSHPSINVSLDCADFKDVTWNDTSETLMVDRHVIKFGKRVLQLAANSPRVSCGDSFAGQVLLGDANGGLSLYASHGEQKTSFEGHLLHTSVAKFFASGKVALSSGMDYKIKIWDVSTGNLAQSLIHQKGLVEAVELIDRGRNLVSLCPDDATVVLWEVGGAEVVQQLTLPGVRCINVASAFGGPLEDDTYEYGIAGKSVVLGTLDKVQLWDFRSSRPQDLIDGGATTVSVAGNKIAYGFDNKVNVVDIRNDRQKLMSYETPSVVKQVTMSPSGADLYILADMVLFNASANHNKVLVTDTSTAAIKAISAQEQWAFGQIVYKY